MKPKPAQTLACHAAEHPAAGIARLLDAILAGLLGLIGTRVRFLAVQAMPLYTRLSRMRERLDRLLGHLAAGRARRPTRPRPGRPRAPASAPAAPALPTRPGWVAHVLDYNARNLASQLDHLLNRPGVAECLAAAPGAARTIRPLCRSLGVAVPAALRLPPRPPRPPKSSPAPPPRAAPPDRPGTPDRPLPRYVRAAMRAWNQPVAKTA